MREIIHRIYIPLGAGTMMWMLDDTIHDRIAEMHVGRRHIYLRTEHTRTLIKLTCIHPFKQIKIFLHRAATIRAFHSRHCGTPLLFGYLFRCLVIYISLTLFNQAHSQIIELREIVTCVIFTVSPIKSEPMYILAD